MMLGKYLESRAVPGPRCLGQDIARKLAEDVLSSDPRQTATANWTILIARAKVHAEVHTEVHFASALLAIVRLQPLDYILDRAGDERLVPIFPGPLPRIVQWRRLLVTFWR
ncbi:hypothetical protein BCON_0047g00400 [Botryotinia convoluta]|uniref:Uncharacterized protein n=1 Tax=Botryotinia convoluta TaxID=54673 RepID=A0A4Z1IC48_9HELO|nr:hypothetical protein BCON_0047g00400 [Botryotinia convoluta]